MKILKGEYKGYEEVYLVVYDNNRNLGLKLVISSNAPKDSKDNYIYQIVVNTHSKVFNGEGNRALVLKSTKDINLYVNKEFVVLNYSYKSINKYVLLRKEGNKMLFIKYYISLKTLKLDITLDEFKKVKYLILKSKDFNYENI